MRIQRIEQNNCKKQQNFGVIYVEGQSITRSGVRALADKFSSSQMGDVLERGIEGLRQVDSLFVHPRTVRVNPVWGKDQLGFTVKASPAPFEVKVGITPAEQMARKIIDGYCFLRAQAGSLRYSHDNISLADKAGLDLLKVDFTPVTNSLIKINGESVSHPSIDRLLDEAGCSDMAVRNAAQDNILRLTSLDKVLGNGQEVQIKPLKTNSGSYAVLSRVTNESGATTEVRVALNNPATLGTRFEDAYCYLRAQSIDYDGYLQIGSVTIK